MPPAPICVVMSETPILLPVTGAKGLKGIVFASRGRDYSCVTAKGKSDWFNSRMVGYTEVGRASATDSDERGHGLK